MSKKPKKVGQLRQFIPENEQVVALLAACQPLAARLAQAQLTPQAEHESSTSAFRPEPETETETRPTLEMKIESKSKLNEENKLGEVELSPAEITLLSGFELVYDATSPRELNRLGQQAGLTTSELWALIKTLQSLKQRPDPSAAASTSADPNAGSAS
jgi:hypothetical protein